jgi:hypothetical protein
MIKTLFTAALNGTNFTHHMWNTTWSPYVDLFGSGFFLIPVSFIGAALFMKTRDPAIISIYMITTGILLSAGGLFTGFTGGIGMYIIFTSIGLGSLIYSVILGRGM